MNVLVLIVVHRLCAESTLPEERIMPLSLQLTFAPSAEASRISQNKQAFVPQVNLNHGTYHSNGYMVDSVSLSLHGSDTKICHTSLFANTESVNDPNSENHGDRNGNTTPFIFVFSNSTISMSHISLDCGWRGTGVGRIWSSRLTIENCPIVSNPESSPFVMNNGWDDFGSSIFFVDCSHKSIEKSSLLPLVNLAPSHTTHASHIASEQNVASALVSCSGLSLSDTHLVFGSGPLVGFSSSTEPNTRLSDRLETVLIGSRLVNMTSGHGKGALEGWSGSQTILGSSVTRSTNHLYGTTCIGMNLGGSLLCSNTSFSHCHTSLEPEFVNCSTYILQHKTGDNEIQIMRVTTTSEVLIRRCTFLSMTTPSNGAAVYDTVSECSFSNCRASASGGAFYFFQTQLKEAPFSITSSLFVECSSWEGGAINSGNSTTSTITDSVFRNNTADSKAGALLVGRADVLLLSNCSFEKCVAGGPDSWGGGVRLNSIESFTMDSVLFRECSAVKGNDIYFSTNVGTIEELLPNITNCDSTSKMSNVCFYNYPNDILDDTLIPSVPDTSTASLMEIGSSPKTDQTSSTIQMTVSQNVNGKMLVLVDNTNKHEPPNDDSHPAIPRLLTFDFSSSTDSATQTVSFGEWEELQYESDYCVIGASIANTRLSFSSSIALTTPNPARIVQVVYSLGSGTDHCWLQLKGRSLPIGKYTVKLKDPILWFSVEFDGSTEENTSTLISSLHSEKLFGTGSKLTFLTKYEVESVIFEGNNEPVILDPPRLLFTTPAPQPRVTSVSMVGFKDDSTKDTVLISFFGLDLPTREYVIRLLSPTNESVSFQIRLEHGTSNQITATVYSKDSSKIQLTYGLIYTVTEMTSGPTICLVDKALSIEVPAEPKRIEEGSVTLNGAKNEATVRLKGRVLTDGTYTLKLNYMAELTSEATLSDDGEVLFKVPINLSSSSILTFGETYTISWLKLLSDDVLVNSDVELAVPNLPIATMASCSLDAASNSKFSLTLNGSNIPTSGLFIVSFDGLNQTIAVTMNSSGGLSSPIEVSKATEIQFGQTYTISSIVERVDGQEDEHILCSGLTMKTPDGPSLLRVDSATLKVDDLNRVVLDVSFVDMAAGSFVMKVRNNQTLIEYTLSSPIVTTFGSVTGTLTELVYESGKLEYGASYTIVSLESSTLPILIKDTTGFTVPDEPKRIENGRVTLNGAKDEATVRLKGRVLTDGNYSLTLASVASVLTSEAALSGDGEVLFKAPINLSSSSILAFGQTCTISSLKFGSKDVIVNSGIELAVPNPPIVTSVQMHPNSISTTMTLGLAGTDLELDGFYTVTLSPPFSFAMLFNSSKPASSSELLLGRVDSLQHNTEYAIVSITRVDDASDVILTDGNVSFTTPKCRVPLLLHVNDNEGEDDAFCGEIDDPCATIDFAWSIVSALKAKTAILSIVKSSEQTHPILLSSGMSVDITNGETGEPTLIVPSSASVGDQTGMVVVNEATFSIIDVTVKIESTDPSFVFLVVSESTIILKEGSIIGQPMPTLSLNSDSEDVCSWDSGIIRLDNCTTTLNRMTLSSLSQGAIHMKKGCISIESSSLHDNSPNLVSFPSARRNIRCVEGGNVTIGSLNGGDGSKDHPSAWISATDCKLSGEDARPDSPLFVPALSSESASSWDKKEKKFSMSIVGTTMIPCGLSLEVFEMKKDKSEGKSTRVELSFNSTDSFNETHINLSIPLTSLSSLDKSCEWRGRLIFGLNQTTSESFVVQKNSTDRFAESSLDNMKWWLPLVIVLLCCALVAIFVVVVVFRRRQKRKDLDIKEESGNEMVEDKMEVEQFNHEGENTVVTSVGVLKAGSLNQEGGDQSKTVQTKQMNTPLSECVSVLDCSLLETKEMLKMETLFDRLHRNKKGLFDKRPKQIELARGLQKLGKMNNHADVLLRLSSHWILVDVDGRLNIQMNRGPLPPLDEQSQANQTIANVSVVPEDSRLVNVNNENSDGMDRAAKLTREKEDQEDQRWQAPEQGGSDAIQPKDLEKVTVFRLGLVLWEIETGQVPFRETDGVNAGRQLKAGVKPNLELVQNKEMQELLLKCLELKSDERIDLDNLISSLGSIPDDPIPSQQLFRS